jgi:hypothetical protein
MNGQQRRQQPQQQQLVKIVPLPALNLLAILAKRTGENWG